jgi:AbrB family looped-hinge helix DNA binding protein
MSVDTGAGRHRAMGEVVEGLPTKRARIIALFRKGYSRSEIAAFLGLRYQHVRNELVQAGYSATRLAEPDADGCRPPADEAIDRDAQARVAVGPDGRIVIPARFRAALGIGAGDDLIVRLEGDEIRIVSHRAELRRIRELIARTVPAGQSLVDDLADERRREADLEEGVD